MGELHEAKQHAARAKEPAFSSSASGPMLPRDMQAPVPLAFVHWRLAVAQSKLKEAQDAEHRLQTSLRRCSCGEREIWENRTRKSGVAQAMCRLQAVWEAAAKPEEDRPAR